MAKLPCPVILVFEFIGIIASCRVTVLNDNALVHPLHTLADEWWGVVFPNVVMFRPIDNLSVLNDMAQMHLILTGFSVGWESQRITLIQPDTVEQLADGKVTLWFQEGSEANWTASTLTYTDGSKSVKVTGVGMEDITLIFGSGNAQYNVLLAAGAFSESTSERIFEDSSKGMLA